MTFTTLVNLLLALVVVSALFKIIKFFISLIPFIGG